jgi:hypothetical protein
MGRLSAIGGPRSWQVAGHFVDVLGELENSARTPVRRLEGPHGPVDICPVEELIVERVLISSYPAPYPPAHACAQKLVSAALLEEVETDWAELKRLASTNAYQNWQNVKSLVDEQAKTLQVRSPYDSHG